MVSKFLVGGNLIALSKDKPGFPPDNRAITVGESLRRLVGKCLCRITKVKASEFFSPHQLDVACPYGVEKIVHGLRMCVEEHGNDNDFIVMKIDLQMLLILFLATLSLRNAGNTFLSSSNAQWAAWCYSDHPLLLSAIGALRSETRVQQGDPLGLYFFAWFSIRWLLLLQLTQFAHSFHFTPGTWMMVQNRQCYRHSALLNSLVLH